MTVLERKCRIPQYEAWPSRLLPSLTGLPPLLPAKRCPRINWTLDSDLLLLSPTPVEAPWLAAGERVRKYTEDLKSRF
jgi:hypothetical protein